MKILNNIKTVVTRTMGRGGLYLKKYSPELLMAAGVIGVGATIVLACKATLHLEDAIDKCAERKDVLEKDMKSDPRPTEYKKILTKIYTDTAIDLAKLYGPSMVLGVTSVSCLIGSHGIMKKRNLGLMAAYAALDKSFSDYRERVKEKYGEDCEIHLKNGIEPAEILVTNEDGRVGEQIVSSIKDPNTISQYARFFDESSENWSKTPEYNLLFLRNTQNYANDLLLARGHLFLNEVYDMLFGDGKARSQAGAVVGWVMSKDGDNFVDFGIYDVLNGANRDFINGYEPSILLDFNVDGVIYDKI